MKKCSSCGEEKDLSCFYRQSSSKDGFMYRCKDCDRIARSLHYNTDRGRSLKRNSNRRNKYGIGPDDFNKLWDLQDGCCAICCVVLEDSFSTSHKPNKVVVDHCHNTGKVRGLLCTKCNKGIGLLNDSPEILISAYKYLK